MPGWGILNCAMPQSLSAIYIHLLCSPKSAGSSCATNPRATSFIHIPAAFPNHSVVSPNGNADRVIAIYLTP